MASRFNRRFAFFNGLRGGLAALAGWRAAREDAAAATPFEPTAAFTPAPTARHLAKPGAAVELGYRPRAVVLFGPDRFSPAVAVPDLNGVELKLVPDLVTPTMDPTLRSEFDAFIRELEDAGQFLVAIPEFSCIDPTTLERLTAVAKELSGVVVPDLSRIYRVYVPEQTIADRLVALMQRWTDAVDLAYSYVYPQPLPVDTSGMAPPDDYRGQQGHLDCAPFGIDARHLRGSEEEGTPPISGGLGEGIPFALIDDAWWRSHTDFPTPTPNIVFGFPIPVHDLRVHGNSSLGVVSARIDNNFGVDGIAPAAAARLLTPWDDSGTDRLPCAILRAVLDLCPGLNCDFEKCEPAVILIEAQQEKGSARLPAEFDPACFWAIRVGTALGVAIVEPAGNGAANLDDATLDRAFYDDQRRLHVGDLVLDDSGAIIVGAVTSAYPHELHATSNYGNRVDCYAWGDSVATVGSVVAGTPPVHNYNLIFGETSAASAIVAGAAAAMLGASAAAVAAGAGTVQLVTNLELRQWFSSAEHNTPVYAKGRGVAGVSTCYHEASPEGCDAEAGCIGYMPDLRRLAEAIVP